MTKEAIAAIGKHGVEIMFPRSPNRDIYKLLMANGFRKVSPIGWNIWINPSQSDEVLTIGRDIAQDYNEAKPEKRYKLYPSKRKQ